MSSYARILVHLEQVRGCSARVALAARLAQRFRSRLLGVAPSGDPFQFAAGKPGGIVSAAVIEDARIYRQMKARGSCDEFERQLAALDLPTTAEIVDGLPEQALLERGIGCDLAVIGQPENDDRAYMARQLLLHLGRPVLLVPSAGEFNDAGRRVLLAWDGRRECARAAADAMPFLQAADEVLVCRIAGKEEADSGRGACASAAEWLGLHGVDARTLDLAADGDAGHALLSLAADEGVDLLVMGAYGHAPWAESLMGGVTRTLLESMTVPVLMSH